ncbi:MAG: NUDIX hydrolase [Candidatus Zixiibacteriota bacterium]|nr:MAG: NUDIX hydrolase [candidate division Zixibacteria bacterium]
MERRYGVPSRASFTIDITEKEYNRIHASQTHGRNHDVTLYIRKGDSYVVIAKPFYPAGLYRAPSGGLKPGEDFHEGIRREVNEEAGVEIQLDRFILRTEVDFRCVTGSIYWRSFVFTADYLNGDFEYTDHEEIAEVKLASLSEFETFGKIMRRSDIGGLHYRAALHETVAELI